MQEAQQEAHTQKTEGQVSSIRGKLDCNEGQIHVAAAADLLDSDKRRIRRKTVLAEGAILEIAKGNISDFAHVLDRIQRRPLGQQSRGGEAEQKSKEETYDEDTVAQIIRNIREYMRKLGSVASGAAHQIKMGMLEVMISGIHNRRSLVRVVGAGVASINHARRRRTKRVKAAKNGTEAARVCSSGSSSSSSSSSSSRGGSGSGSGSSRSRSRSRSSRSCSSSSSSGRSSTSSSNIH